MDRVFHSSVGILVDNWGHPLNILLLDSGEVVFFIFFVTVREFRSEGPRVTDLWRADGSRQGHVVKQIDQICGVVGDGAGSWTLLIEDVSEDTFSAVSLFEGVGDAVDWVGESGIVYQIQNAFAQLVLRRVCADIIGPKDSVALLHRLTDGTDSTHNSSGVPI